MADLENIPDNLEEVEESDVDKYDLDLLANYVRISFDTNKKAKQNVEQEMLQSKRQRDGYYDSAVLSNIRAGGMSEVYIQLTSAKCRAAVSMILDILHSADEKPWSIKPTPIPDIDPNVESVLESEVQSLVAEAANVFEQQEGRPIGPAEFNQVANEHAEIMKERLLIGLKEVAKAKAKKMEAVIDDQLTEGNFYGAFKEVIEDIVTYPFGVMKGPIYRKRKTLKWASTDDGDYEPDVQEEIVVEFERTSPYDIYPEGDARTLQDGNLLEVHHMTRKDFNALRKVTGYSKEALDNILSRYGDSGFQEAVSIKQERESAEGREDDVLSDSNRIDALQFWGSISGRLLKEWNAKNDIEGDELEDEEDYEVEIWQVDNIVFKAVLNNDALGKRPYNSASFEEQAGSIIGHGVPFLIRDMQSVTNDTARAMVNNLAIASGPIVEVDISRVNKGAAGGRFLRPWAEIHSSEGQMDKGNAVKFYQANVVINELMLLFNKASQLADEHLGIASFQHGGTDVGQAGETASGLSMLFSSSARNIKTVVGQIDEYIIRPKIEYMYNLNMQFNRRKDIKGDAKVVARGVSSLVARELTQRRRTEFLNFTNNELDTQLMGPETRLELLKTVAKDLELDIDLSKTPLLQNQGGASTPVQSGQAPVPAKTTPLTPGGAPQGGRENNAFTPVSGGGVS